ncbi:MAG: hypothetical protein HY951_06970 [Bacteroidia bacterium]|nr:hypothetical protein [Bacteroidia bacterium]
MRNIITWLIFSLTIALLSENYTEVDISSFLVIIILICSFILILLWSLLFRGGKWDARRKIKWKRFCYVLALSTMISGASFYTYFRQHSFFYEPIKKYIIIGNEYTPDAKKFIIINKMQQDQPLFTFKLYASYGNNKDIWVDIDFYERIIFLLFIFFYVMALLSIISIIELRMKYKEK